MGIYNLTSVKRWALSTKVSAVSVNLSSDSGDLVVADDEQNIRLFDMRGNSIFSTNLASNIIITSISENGKFIAALCEDKTLKLLDSDGKIRWQVKLDNGICTVDINEADGVIVVGSSLKKLYLFKLDGTEVFAQKTEHTIFDLRFAPGTDGIATVSTIGDICFYSYRGTALWSDSISRRSLGIDVSKNGNFIIVPVYNGGVFAFNLFGEYIGTYDVMADVRTAAITASGKLLYLADEKNRLILLNNNAEVIWNSEFSRSIVKVCTNSIGSLCLVMLDGGTAELYELVEEVTPRSDFIEFSEAAQNIEAELIWRRSYKHIYTSTENIQTILSPDGGHIVVFSNRRLSVYRENGLLAWNDTIEDYPVELFMLDNEPFFIVNTPNYLYRYNYRKGRDWKVLLRFDRLLAPIKRGMLYASSKNEIFAIDMKGEIHWQKQMEAVPADIAVSADGTFLAVKEGRSYMTLLNNSGGIVTRFETPVNVKNFCLFSGNIVTQQAENILSLMSLSDMSYTRIISASSVKEIIPTTEYLVCKFVLGGAAVYNKNKLKQFDLPDEHGNLVVFQNIFQYPLLARIHKENITLYDNYGRQIWKYRAGNPIVPQSVGLSAGRMIFFAGTDLYFINIGREYSEPMIVNYLEFGSVKEKAG